MIRFVFLVKPPPVDIIWYDIVGVQKKQTVLRMSWSALKQVQFLIPDVVVVVVVVVVDVDVDVDVGWIK